MNTRALGITLSGLLLLNAAVLSVHLRVDDAASSRARPASAAVERDEAWVERQIAATRASAKEVGALGIGWAGTLAEAFDLSRRSGRPTFVMAGDGDVCTGRL